MAFQDLHVSDTNRPEEMYTKILPPNYVKIFRILTMQTQLGGRLEYRLNEDMLNRYRNNLL